VNYVDPDYDKLDFDDNDVVDEEKAEQSIQLLASSTGTFFMLDRH